MSNEKTDWCTSFPEYWYQWYLGKYNIPKIRKCYIGHCCKKHDDDCSTKVFITCLKRNNVVGRYAITSVAAAACLLKYGKV